MAVEVHETGSPAAEERDEMRELVDRQRLDRNSQRLPFHLDFLRRSIATKGMTALSVELRTLGIAVGVALRIRARLRRIA